MSRCPFCIEGITESLWVRRFHKGYREAVTSGTCHIDTQKAPWLHRMMRLLFFAALAMILQIAHSPGAHAAESHRSSESVRVGGFSDSLFAFVTTVNYDGKSLAGGWQEAIATLKFVDARHFIPQTWTCTVKVGMPIKPGNYGVILPAIAARMSAAAATTTSMVVMKTRPEWIPVSYCIQFKIAMELYLNTTYDKLGAKVWRL